MPLHMRGEVAAIHIRSERGGPNRAVQHASAIAGRGLDGDRYAADNAVKPHQHVTLIEEEAITAVRGESGIPLEPGESRRNITTRGVALNHLVGREFRVGNAHLRGVRLCEPCGYLEKLTGNAVREPLIHRGGLRAEVLASGDIRVGDPIEPLAD